MSGADTAQAAELRPLIFGMVIWGETFRECMLRCLLPSLLAAESLPVDIGCEKNNYLLPARRLGNNFRVQDDLGSGTVIWRLRYPTTRMDAKCDGI